MYKYKFLQVGQLPREHLSFLQNPLNHFITKYLNMKSMTNLAFQGINEAPVTSIIGDTNIYQCHMNKRQWRCYSQWISALSASITE